MRMLTRNAAVELGEHGIRLVGVAPGEVNTPINARTAATARLDAAIPLGKMGLPESAVGLNPVLAVALEALCTVVLVVTVFVLLSHPGLRRFTPWTMSPMYAVMVSIEAPWTGTSAYSARSLGPAVATGTWQGFWIHLVGSALGALLGVAVARLVGRGHREIHQARIAPYPSDPHVGVPAAAGG